MFKLKWRELDLLSVRLAIKYIFFELLPSFLMGLFIFSFIILMFQSLRLAEYVIVHGIKIEMIGVILFYLSISLLPIILPMSLLFSILLIYGRMSSDSEIVAFKAMGLNNIQLSIPALVLAGLTMVLSAQTSFYLAPWGNRQMEVLVHKLSSTKAGIAIKEGVFSEGFFNLVVYANKVNSKNGLLKKVFIYDEREDQAPLTIIAHEGQLVTESNLDGNKAFLRLFNGNIHRTANSIYTKIDFKTYDINLNDPIQHTERKKSNLSYNMNEIRYALKNSELDPKQRLVLLVEWHRRWALTIACLIFALIGIGLGTVTNKRHVKSSNLVLCLSMVIGYWVIYAGFESLGKSGIMPVWMAVWTPNLIFASLAVWSLKRKT